MSQKGARTSAQNSPDPRISKKASSVSSSFDAIILRVRKKKEKEKKNSLFSPPVIEETY